MDHKGLWQAVLGEIEVKMSRANYATWFKNTAIIANEDGNIIVGCPNIFNKERLEKKYHEDIKAAIVKVNGSFRSIEYKVASLAPSPKLKVSAKPEPMERTSSATAVRERQTSIDSPRPVDSNLNIKYTFDNFVVGSSNDLAYAACQAVAKYPGTKYNPLFIYGGAGLGKTHLMQAIGNHILEIDPTKRIRYATSETFTNEFLASLSNNKKGQFADQFRNVDMLIIDDMQFIAGKERTAEEFFHIFNELHQSNKQIVVSSDKPPKAIPNLEDRLRSRFEWGMMADIQMPDFETRSAILQRKASMQGIILPVEVVEYLAQNIQQNIRELEGVLTQLIAHCEVRGLTPSIAVATGLIGNIAATRPKLKPLTSKQILEKTAAYYDLQVSDLTGVRRDKDIVVPRQVAMYLMRHELSLSFPKIAAAVGGRDHTTAMHSVNKIEKQIEIDENLRSEVGLIKERVQI